LNTLPYFSKICKISPYFRSFSVVGSPYFEYDAFTYHALHVGLLDASD